MKFRSNRGMHKVLSPQVCLSLCMSALMSQQLPKLHVTHLSYSVRGPLLNLSCLMLSQSKVHGNIHGCSRQPTPLAHQCLHRRLHQHLHQRLHQQLQQRLHQRRHQFCLKLEIDATGENVALAHSAAALMIHVTQLENIATGESVALEHSAAAVITGAMQSEIVATGESVVSGRNATVLMTDAMRPVITH